MNETNKIEGVEMTLLDIEKVGTTAYKEYQETLKELKREQRAKEQLPQIVFKNLRREKK